MRTGTAQSGRASERSAHKIAEKMALNAGVAFDDWIVAAIDEYAEDLGVDPQDLNERERLEAIEERVDRQARGGRTPARQDAENDDRAASRRREGNARIAQRTEATPRRRDAFDDEPHGNRHDAAEPDALDAAVERIRERARRRNARPASDVHGADAAQNRLEQAVSEVEKRAERDAERTARALQSLVDIVETRGEPRAGLQQTVEDLQQRAERNERRTARALESLTGRLDTQVGDRAGFEAAIERIAKRAEQSEARTARALESLTAPVRPAAAPPPSRVDDAVAARLDALARRAARAPEPQADTTHAETTRVASEDDETFRLVSERLARRRKQRQESAPAEPASALEAPHPGEPEGAVAEMQRQLRRLADKIDSLASPAATEAPAAKASESPDAKDAALARMEQQLAGLAERIERVAATPPPAPRAEPDRRPSALQGVERRLDDLGARIEASTRRPVPDAKPLEDLAHRIEAIRASLERQTARPDGAPVLAALSHLNEKLDRAAASGSQSAATMVALQGMIGRLEEAVQRPTATPIDPRPIDELARRIEGVRGLVERQAAFAPRLDEIQAAVADLQQRLDRPLSSAAEIERLETALHQLSADVRALRQAGTPDLKPVEQIAGQIEAMRQLVERQSALAPQVEQIHVAVGELNRKLDRPAISPAGFGRLEAAFSQLSTDVLALGRAPAPDMAPVEELGRRIETMRKAVESNGALTPQVDRLERGLAEIRARLDRPMRSLEIDAVDATLRQLAAKFDEVVSRPATVALDPKPIEELARRIESVRESLERPQAPPPHVERLENALGAIADKLDRAQPTMDAQGINSALAEMNARLEEAFRRSAPVEIDSQPIEALAAQIEAVRETLERQAGQLDVGRFEETLREAVERLERPGIGREEFRAIVAAIQALALKIDGGASAAQEDALERIAERLDRYTVEPSDFATLAGAIGELAAKVDRPAADMSRLEALLAQATARPETPADLSAVGEALADIRAKLDRDAAGPNAERLFEEVASRLDSLESHMVARPANAHDAHLEIVVRELVEKLADFGAVSDTRAVEQEVRVLQEKMDDLADARMSSAFAEQTAQAITRALGERAVPDASAALIEHLRDIQEAIDKLAARKSAPVALEQPLADLTEELEGLRSAREAVGRGAATLSEMRAAQLQLDRRMDARFAGVQEILEKLVDRMDSSAAPLARPATAPSPRTAMLDIPDRSADESRPIAAPSIDPGLIGTPERPREGAEGAKAAAINAHIAIAAARRAANANAAEVERREQMGTVRKVAEKASSGWAQQAASLFQQHRMPVLIGAAGAMTLLTGVAVYELRGHTPVRKSELETAGPPLAQSAPYSAGADMTQTGAIESAPQVIAAPLPATPVSDGPKPAAALVAALPLELGSALAGAAGNGDLGAEVEIAQRYLEGRTVARDPKTAAAWLQAAADAGSAFAQYRLGALYEKGVGVPRDAARARELYLKAADAGNTRAMHNLAVLYAQDGGVGKPDYAKALEWFGKAALYGVRDSQFNLGVLYGRGLGATQDLAQSWMWFSVGAREGDTDAARKRDEVANRMDGRAMATAQKMLDGYKAKTPDPAVNNAPADPAAPASTPAGDKAAAVKG